MKFLLLIFTFVLGFNASAYTIIVRVLEGHRQTPVDGFVLTLRSYAGKTSHASGTDKDGIAVFEDVKKKKVMIYAWDPTGKYDDKVVYLTRKSDKNITIVLPLSREFTEKKILQMEDSIYGPLSNESISLLEDMKATDSVTFAKHPDGDEGMKSFIRENFQYPEISRELGDTGKVVVKFAVEPDGMISHISIDKSVTDELDREAIRLIRLMGKWQAATINGSPVRAICRLPITFSLSEKKRKKKN